MTCDPVTWQIITIVGLSMGVGFLSGAALFYPIGRRHGILVMAAEWRKSNAKAAGRTRDDE